MIQAAAQMAAEKFSVDTIEVFAPGRGPKSTVPARHWAYLQLTEGRVPGQECGWSSVEIGRLLGRDASAVSEGIRRARAVEAAPKPDNRQDSDRA